MRVEMQSIEGIHEDSESMLASAVLSQFVRGMHDSLLVALRYLRHDALDVVAS